MAGSYFNDAVLYAQRLVAVGWHAHAEGKIEPMIRDASRVASPRVVNVEDLRVLAKKRLPKAVFDYLDGGAEDEITLRNNCRVFEELTFRPRQAVESTECDPRTTVLGKQISFPGILAPVGYSRLMHPGGEVAAAAAAGAAGTAYTLSTVSAYKLWLEVPPPSDRRPGHGPREAG